MVFASKMMVLVSSLKLSVLGEEDLLEVSTVAGTVGFEDTSEEAGGVKGSGDVPVTSLLG